MGVPPGESPGAYNCNTDQITTFPFSGQMFLIYIVVAGTHQNMPSISQTGLYARLCD